MEVITAAKRPLRGGETIDRLGGYCTYGLAENAGVARVERLLPMGLAEGCRMRHGVATDHVLTYDDVEVPEGRLSDRLRAEQEMLFAAAPG